MEGMVRGRPDPPWQSHPWCHQHSVQGWQRGSCWVCVGDAVSPGATESRGLGTVLLPAPGSPAAPALGGGGGLSAARAEAGIYTLC